MNIDLTLKEIEYLRMCVEAMDRNEVGWGSHPVLKKLVVPIPIRPIAEGKKLVQPKTRPRVSSYWDGEEVDFE